MQTYNYLYNNCLYYPNVYLPYCYHHYLHYVNYFRLCRLNNYIYYQNYPQFNKQINQSSSYNHNIKNNDIVPLKSNRLPNEDNSITIPSSAKTKKIIPIGDEFFIPEFKLAQCDQDESRFGFKISSKPIQNAFRNAGESVKNTVINTAEKIYNEVDKLINNNNEKIKKLEKEIEEVSKYLYTYLDCPPNEFDTSPYCLTPEAKKTIKKLNELREKLNKLKSKSLYQISIKSFTDNLKKLSQSEIPNVKWPKEWPRQDELRYLPILFDEYIKLPKTLIDTNIDPSLAANISLPKNIKQMLNIPKTIDININLDTIKEQIQWDELEYDIKQVLTDVANGILAEIKKYNMCLFIKNSPYIFQIKLEYISDFKKLVEFYIYGCLEKAKNSALLVLAKNIPSIVNTYGATLPFAISEAITTYWYVLKKCLFDVYNTFKQEVEKITDAQSFDEFLKAIEKYISIDFELEKRNVPWENKGSLIDLVSKTITVI